MNDIYKGSRYKGWESTIPCGCERPHKQREGCCLNKPLLMVIPPEGIHISCPAHPKGHHIYGQQVRC